MQTSYIIMAVLTVEEARSMNVNVNINVKIFIFANNKAQLHLLFTAQSHDRGSKEEERHMIKV